jgi:hypothetical protein
VTGKPEVMAHPLESLGGSLVLTEFGSFESGDVKGTIRSDMPLRSVSNDVRRHRVISVSYISLLPCHGSIHCELERFFPEHRTAGSIRLQNLGRNCSRHYDTARSSSVRKRGPCNQHGTREDIPRQDRCEWTSIPGFFIRGLRKHH